MSERSEFSAIIKLMGDAAQEIERLRRHNEVLAAKVEMIDLFTCVLHSQPATRSLSQGVDIAWKLRQAIDAFSTETRDE